MDRFIILIPHLILAIFSFAAVFITNGTKYSIKKSLLITIPLLILVCSINIVVFMNNGIPTDKLDETLYFWFAITIYTPINLVVLIVTKRKPLSYLTAGVNLFLAYYFIALTGKLIQERTSVDWIIYIWYVVAISIAFVFIKVIYIKLQNTLETVLPKYLGLLTLYASLMILEIYAYSELIRDAKGNSLRLEIFSIAIISVYLTSIIIFYFIINHYRQTYEENSNLILMKGQVQSIQDQYKMREMKDEEVKILRHDMKHILITVSSLIKNDKNNEALDFINEYVSTIDATKGKVFCNDSIINSILDYYWNKAEQEEVTLNIKINNIEDVLNVPSYETAVLISNCLDNAIKAANKLKNNRIVDFTFWNNDGRLILQCKNNYDGIILIDKDGRPTNLAKGHGLGSDSIELFAKKYNLNITYQITENVYKISIIF